MTLQVYIILGLNDVGLSFELLQFPRIDHFERLSHLSIHVMTFGAELKAGCL